MAPCEKTDRRHRAPTEAQRDERVKLDADPDDALRKILGVQTEDDDDKADDEK